MNCTRQIFIQYNPYGLVIDNLPTWLDKTVFTSNSGFAPTKYLQQFYIETVNSYKGNNPGISYDSNTFNCYESLFNFAVLIPPAGYKEGSKVTAYQLSGGNSKYYAMKNPDASADKPGGLLPFGFGNILPASITDWIWLAVFGFMTARAFSNKKERG